MCRLLNHTLARNLPVRELPDLSYVALLAVRLRADARLLPLNTGR